MRGDADQMLAPMHDELANGHLLRFGKGIAQHRVAFLRFITIGKNVSISPEVHIITADHDISTDDIGGRERPVTIGDFVFVGSRATILPGVDIGEGAVVAAGAVVTKSVGPREIVAGIPARKIAMRTAKFAYNTKVVRHFF